MKFCTPHWHQLRDEITAQGMGDWIAPTGETAAAQLVDQLQRHEATVVNYDPLMACHNMILNRALDLAGLVIFAEDFGCPICRFNEHRTPDGACTCGQPECGAAAPGSVPDFETWIVGPTSCVAAARTFMVEQGWLQ